MTARTPMADIPQILCIGSVLWDVIGRCEATMVAGNDKPGRIVSDPGGVALNIARTLAAMGVRPALLSVLGTDPEGDALVAACAAMGIGTGFVLRDPGLPTDRYMAIEAQGQLVAAIADAHSLEAAGERILAPLTDGRLASTAAPWTGPVALDGNLTEALLTRIAASPVFAAADLRLAPASPGKAARLRPCLAHPGATLYVNLEEAGLIAGGRPHDAAEGAAMLLATGARRVLVTNGAGNAAFGAASNVIERRPPAITPRRVTGAGDTFLAAHIAAELRGAGPEDALTAALAAAADFVAGDAA